MYWTEQQDNPLSATDIFQQPIFSSNRYFTAAVNTLLLTVPLLETELHVRGQEGTTEAGVVRQRIIT